MLDVATLEWMTALAGLVVHGFVAAGVTWRSLPEVRGMPPRRNQ